MEHACASGHRILQRRESGVFERKKNKAKTECARRQRREDGKDGEDGMCCAEGSVAKENKTTHPLKFGRWKTAETAEP